MSAVLQIPVTLRDGAGRTVLQGTFDACLDAWIALSQEERASATMASDASVPELGPDVTWPLGRAAITKAVLMRETAEWP